MSVADCEELRRLGWQCRRGLLELDLLFKNFLAERYVALSTEEREAFSRLLEQPDSVLLAWLQGSEQPSDDLKKIVTIITQ